MLKTQNELLGYLNSLAQVIEKVRATNLDISGEPEQTQNFVEAIRDRELLVPVVGAFSAGKSSLLNAIIGNSILPMDIKPETAIPTELRYDTNERLEAFFADGRTENFDIHQLPSLQERAEELHVIRLYLNRPALNGLSPLVLVDMPGFNSPLDAHNKAIAHYIGQGAHYLFVVSVEEGSLHKQIIRNMDEVSVLGRSFSVCINKADLKPASDVEKICTYIGEQLADEGFNAAICSVSKNDIASVGVVLESINPEALFKSIFQRDLLQQNISIEHTLVTALDGLKSDKQSNEKKITEIEIALRSLEQERESKVNSNTIANLESSVEDVLHTVRNRLSRSVDELASAALRSKEDMSRIISDEVRSGITYGLKLVTDNMSAQMVADFSRQISGSVSPSFSLAQSDWTDSLLQTLQSQLLPTLLSSLAGDKKSSSSGVLAATGVAAMIAKFIPHPIVKVAVTFVPAIISMFFSRMGEERKLEQAKEAIRNQVLPGVESQLRPSVSEFLLSAQEQMVQGVAAAFDQQIQAQKDILQQINQQAESGNLEANIAALEDALSEVRALALAHLQAPNK